MASGTDRHLDITFRWHVFRSSSLVSVLFREVFSHPYISFFHLLVNGFSVTSFCTFFDDPFLSLYWWTVSVGEDELKLRQLYSTPSANEPAKGLILVHTVTAKTNDKSKISGRMVSTSVSVIVTASVYSEKTRLKKLMMINIYYCMTGRAIRWNIPYYCMIGRAIWWNILFEIDCIGPTEGRDDAEIENGIFHCIARPKELQ